MREMLEASKSGYYSWLKSDPSKRWLENQTISIEIHTNHTFIKFVFWYK